MIDMPCVESVHFAVLSISILRRGEEGWPEEVLVYFSDDAVINVMGPIGTLAGKRMVAENMGSSRR